MECERRTTGTSGLVRRPTPGYKGRFWSEMPTASAVKDPKRASARCVRAVKGPSRQTIEGGLGTTGSARRMTGNAQR